MAMRVYGTASQVITTDAKVTRESVRKTVATLSRYDRTVRKLVVDQIRQSEGEIIDLARGSAERFRDTGTLRKSIRRLRRRPDPTDSRIVRGGVTVSARHALTLESGNKARKAQPFFYQQIDVVFPRFENAVKDIVARRAAARAHRG